MKNEIDQLISEVVKKSELENSYYKGAIEALNLLKDRLTVENEEAPKKDNKSKRIPKS